MTTVEWFLPHLCQSVYVTPDTAPRAPGARPTNDMSIELEIRPKYAVLWFEMYSTDHNDILYTSRQYLSWRVRNVVVIR